MSEPNDNGVPDGASLLVHIEYEYLTVSQLGSILESLDGIYLSLADIFIYERFEYISSPKIIYYPVPLCVEKVETGRSIDVLVSFAAQALPSLDLGGTQPHLILPDWSAILIILGWVARWGVDFYQKIQEMRLSKLEIDEKKRNRISEMENEIGALEAKLKRARIDLAKLSRDTPARERLSSETHRLRATLKHKNIRSVNMNGRKLAIDDR